MKIMLATLLGMASIHVAHAQLFSAVGEGYTEVRGGIAHAVSSFYRGNCAEITARACDACQTDGVTGLAPTPEGQGLAAAVNQLQQREDVFFQTAASQEHAASACEVRQLDAVMAQDPSKTFQQTILRDIARKLPELRRRHRRMRVHQGRIERAQGVIDGYLRSRAAGSPAFEADIARQQAIIAAETGPRNAELQVFNPLLASIWRFDDPHMGDFIMRLVHSDRAPEEVCTEALQADASEGFLGWQGLLGRGEFSFQEQVLAPMRKDAQKDHENLERARRGTSFDVASIGSSTRRMLVRESNWAAVLGTSGDEGNIANGYLMCELDRSYGQGDRDLMLTLETASLLAGGTGAILKAAKFATLLRPAAIQRALGASRVLSIASFAPAVPLSIAYITDACAEHAPGQSYDVRNGGTCVVAPGQLVDGEARRLGQENCALNLALAGVALAPGTWEFLGRYRPGGRAAAMEAADEARRVAATRAARVRENRYLAVEEGHTEIVVTARRRGRRARAASSTERPVDPWESRSAELADAAATRSEFDALLGSLGDDLPGLRRSFDELGVDGFIARHADGLGPEGQARLRLLAGRLERHRALDAAAVVSGAEVDAFATRLGLSPAGRENLRERLNGDNIEDFRAVMERAGAGAVDDIKLGYILDEVTGLRFYTGPQRERAIEGIVTTLRQWDRPTGATLQAVLQGQRNQRVARDVEREAERIRRAGPALADDVVRTRARAAALARHERRLVLRRACTDRRIGGNTVSARAGGGFMTASLWTGVGSTALTYATVHWDQVKDESWATRLGYEVVQAYIISRWGSLIARNQSGTTLGRMFQTFNLSTILSGIESSAYVSLFGGNEEAARARLRQLQDNPRLEADLTELENYVRNRSGIEVAVDAVGDFGNNLVRLATGREVIKDVTLEDLQRLDPATLRDPAVVDRMMDVIEDQLYSEELGGDTYGNQFVDRVAYDAEWNLSPMGVPRSVLVGMASYYAYCTNIDNPVAAFAALGMIQGVSRAGAGFYYYQGKEEEINQ